MTKYLVQNVEQKTKKDGKPYWEMKLGEVGGKSSVGKSWDVVIPSGVVIDAVTEAGEWKGQPQLTIKQFKVVSDQAASDEFLPHTKKNVDTMYHHLQEFVRMVQDMEIRLLLEKAIEDPRWKRWPAAMIKHQAWLGGLLEHVVLLCRLCHAVSLLYDPHLRTDLMVAGAILHDIGKLDELECTTEIKYTDAGQLLGHINIGMHTVSSMMEKLGTPPETRLLIQHIILSHHGQRIWGSPVVPMIPEALAFHFIDNMDAKLGAFFEEVERSAGKVWSEKNYTLETRIYLGHVTPEQGMPFIPVSEQAA